MAIIYAIIDGNGRISEVHNVEWMTEADKPADGILIAPEIFHNRFNYLWNGNQFIVSPPAKTLAQAKGEKIKAIRLSYKNHMDAGYTAPDGKVYDLTKDRLLEISAQTIKATIYNDTRGAFKVFGNQGGSVVRQSFTAAQFIDLATAISDHISAANDKLFSLTSTINNATTEAEVNAVVW